MICIESYWTTDAWAKYWTISRTEQPGGPGDWDANVYAGGLLAGFEERVRWLEPKKE